ncbi:MAG: YceD family protein [Gammaproteobacteria bacterium SHHR-1]
MINPWRLIQLHKGFAGKAGAEALPRLSAAVQAILGEVEYHLLFGRNEQRQARINGEVRAQVQMECRRCLSPVQLALHSTLELAPVATEAEAERLPEELDLVVLQDTPMRPLDLIEDELLLSLPAYPCHPEESCIEQLVPEEQLASLRPPEAEEVEPPSPFAVLAGLKKSF